MFLGPQGMMDGNGDHRERRVLSDVLVLEVNPGKAIPRRIRDYIPEQHFHKLKVFCSRARNKEDFERIVSAFCDQMCDGVQAITAIEQGKCCSGSNGYSSILSS